MSRLFRKVTNAVVTVELLDARTRDLHAKGYAKAKWIEFCEAMMQAGYCVKLYEARQTFSKYITVIHPASLASFKVRFSNHKPAFERERSGDCDFFVGRCNNTTTNTAQAIAATLASLGPNTTRVPYQPQS